MSSAVDDNVIKAQVIVCRVVRSIGRPGFVDASHCLVDPSSQPQSETPCPLIDLVSEREGVGTVHWLTQTRGGLFITECVCETTMKR